MEIPMSIFRAVLRILREEAHVSAWLVDWLRSSALHDATRDVSYGTGLGTDSVSMVDSADGTLSSDIDVHSTYDQISPQEFQCLPFLPTQDDLDKAIIWDYDMRHLNEVTFGAMIPMARDNSTRDSRFVNAIMMLNTSMNPMPKGVSVLPGHRLSGFRTRYGYACIAVGSCTDGSMYITLSRLWDNYRWKLETFHTASIEHDATLLSYAVIERPGLCTQKCGPGRCICWRPACSRREDGELAKALDWKDFAVFTRDALGASALDVSEMQCRAFFGNGQLAFRLDLLNSKTQATFGSLYPNMSHLKFLFLDRLTTASSVWHSRPIKLETGTKSEKDNADHKRKFSDIESGGGSADESGSRPKAGLKSVAHACGTCGKALSRASDLRRHIETIHNHIQNFACKSCGKRFKQGSHLHTHVRIVHEKRRDFKCTVCATTFSVVSNWKRHMRAIHPNHV
ncbi:Zinc finger and BTB domain-containing protein 44 [Porphyridium purpureum]|uniref:Zinc finger and BTB domain-containing protein 44 n=1 Tax=Porphyridium purpureum TaxID=35688 RepID=A0A5J4Z1K9_PORPP|nr:Zinc finger and BTB domain-containing protein 44 [Porphyridium purpureum]|eukprot:POR3977..scf208_2